VHGFCLDPEQVYQLLRDDYNPRCMPLWNEADLCHKVASVCAAPNAKPRGYLLGNDVAVAPPPAASLSGFRAPPKKIVYDRGYLQEFTAELSDETIDDDYLEARSEFTCHNRSPAGFLHKIFRQGESVWVTDNLESGEGLIWTHDGRVQNLAELNHLATGHRGVWFLANPIDGAPHKIERLQSQFNPDGISFRATECVTNWRHAVLETDCAPTPLWLKTLVLLELPIVAICASGRRGPHALIRFGGSSLEQWHALLEPHREHLVRLGACEKTLTPIRLMRLANCMRAQTRRLQKLLYLAPHTDSIPIARRQVREDPLAVWERSLWQE